MVNVGLNPGAMLGIVLFVAGAGLYFLRSVRPELARDHDIFFMAVAVLSGGILFFQGWRLDPILTFGQFLLTGSAIFFAVESIRLRGLATAQAKRNTPIVDDERPVSRVYRAELDELEPDEEPPRSRPMIGSRYTADDLADEYSDEIPRRPSRRSGSGGRPSGSASRRTKRRPRPPETRQTRQPRDWEASDYDVYGSNDRDIYPADSRNGDLYSQESRPTVSSSKPRRNRPLRSEESIKSGNYVDYQPVDPLEDEGDNSGNFDY